MSYREEDGQVILTMSREDYEQLIYRLGMYAGQLFVRGGGDFRLNVERELRLLNRINEGKPDYTPYLVEAKK